MLAKVFVSAFAGSLALLIFSARIVFQRRRDAETLSKQTALQLISCRRFFIFFGLALLVVITGLFVIRDFLIAWWLGPWYTWSWPEWFV
ncbi:MAG: hypothetical protein JW829_02950 [Pirellulales bacterium]|nr:hypothetical protein [Pirellulales bacterium]